MAPMRPLVLLALAGLFLLSACGDDDSPSGSSASSGSSAATEVEHVTPAVTFEVTEPSEGTVAIDGPKTIYPGVVNIVLRNSGRTPHDGQIVRVEGDRTAQEVIEGIADAEAGAPIPDWLRAGGGMGTVAPGDAALVTQDLEPGTYFMVDTEGGDGGSSNAERGGIVRFAVTGEDVGGELPSTEARITAEDYGFEAAGIEPGDASVTFENAGREPHHVVALPLADGATLADAERALASGEPPPVDREHLARTAVLDGGGEQVIELELERRRYALVCLLADRAGGPPHVAKGMITELEVR